MTLVGEAAPHLADQAEYLNREQILELSVGSLLRVTYEEFHLTNKQKIAVNDSQVDDPTYAELGAPSVYKSNLVRLIWPVRPPGDSLIVHTLDLDQNVVSTTPRVILPGESRLKYKDQRSEILVNALARTLVRRHQA